MGDDIMGGRGAYPPSFEKVWASGGDNVKGVEGPA